MVDSRLLPVFLMAGVMLIGVALAGAQTPSAQAPATSRDAALKVLDAYTATQNKLKRFIIHCEQERDGDCRLPPPYTAHDGKSVYHEAGEIRGDGRRCAVRLWSWGNIFSSAAFINREEAHYNSVLFDGKRYLQYGWNPYNQVVPLGTGSCWSHELEPDENIMIVRSPDAALFGYLYDNNYRVDAILRQAKDLALDAARDANGAVSQYIIRAMTSRGSYALWLDPVHDYQIARAEFHRGGGDIIGKAKPLPQGFKDDYVLDKVKFQKVGELWLPVEATWTFFQKHPTQYYQKTTVHIKRTRINLAPDFTALHAFEPDDIRDGARFFQGDPSVQYIWNHGTLIPQPNP